MPVESTKGKTSIKKRNFLISVYRKVINIFVIYNDKIGKELFLNSNGKKNTLTKKKVNEKITIKCILLILTKVNQALPW